MNEKQVIEKARENFLSGIGIPARGEFKADDFQLEAVRSITEGYDTLVVAPTGSGKTYIAFESIAATLQQGLRAVYTTPLKALSNSKYNELRGRFEPDYKVGILTGDRKIQGDASVIVATTEIYRNELYRSSERFSLVVLDEVHFIADPQRGPVWEETIILTPRSCSLLMLSASISNATEIAEWIEEVRGRECRIVIKTERPVELRFGFLHPDYGALPLNDEHGNLFREVRQYYGSSNLDPTGMRVVGGRGGRGQRERGGGVGGRRHNSRGNSGNRRGGSGRGRR